MCPAGLGLHDHDIGKGRDLLRPRDDILIALAELPYVVVAERVHLACLGESHGAIISARHPRDLLAHQARHHGGGERGREAIDAELPLVIVSPGVHDARVRHGDGVCEAGADVCDARVGELVHLCGVGEVNGNVLETQLSERVVTPCENVAALCDGDGVRVSGGCHVDAAAGHLVEQVGGGHERGWAQAKLARRAVSERVDVTRLGQDHRPGLKIHALLGGSVARELHVRLRHGAAQQQRAVERGERRHHRPCGGDL